MPVTFVLSSVSVRKVSGWSARCHADDYERTFSGIRGLVVLSKPGEIFVFDPWHPRLVFLAIVSFRPLGIGLVLLWLRRDNVLWVHGILFRHDVVVLRGLVLNGICLMRGNVL
jgi:hypothetical protein